MKKIITGIFIAILGANASAEADFELLKKRFKQDVVLEPETAAIFFVPEIRHWRDSIKPNGAWEDIPYHLDDNQFSPGEHPRRFDFMARAYSSPGHPNYKDRKVLKAIIKAYDFWTKRNYQSYNWWHNTIGIPQRFARTMLLLEEELGEKRISLGIRILRRAKISRTGQNRLWYSELTVIRGAFEESEWTVAGAAKEIHKVLNFADAESEFQGIQKDYSFHQHGPLIYNGGYGSKYSRDMSRLVAIFAGTKFSFPKHKVELLSNYILDGQIWMSRGNKWDYSVTGREITRKGKSAEKLIQACKLLKERDLPRNKEFKKCYEALTANKAYLNGNKFFWRSDYMIHQTPSFSMSARMYSRRTANNDAPSNSEGLLSHHLADGSTFIMRRGDEYEDVFPVWDWRHIPGTTVEKKKLRPAIYEPGNWDGFAHIRYMGASSFVGGVSDGENGLATMDFISNKQYENLDAMKSWFFDDSEVWAMGSDIRCRGCEEVVTTIDQKNAFGDVYLLFRNGEVKKFAKKEESYRDLLGVYHDGIGYYLPSKQDVTISLKEQVGDWKRINGQYSGEKIKKKVFNLWISHKASDEYVYVVKPGVTLEQFRVGKPDGIFHNSAEWSAVKFEQKILASVRKAGSFNFAGIDFQADRPAAFIYDIGKARLTVSDPQQKYQSVRLKVDEQDYEIQFPYGEEAGRPVSIETGED